MSDTLDSTTHRIRAGADKTLNGWRSVIYSPDDPQYIADALRDKLQSRIDDGTACPTYAIEMPDPNDPTAHPFCVAFFGNGPKGERNSRICAASPELHEALECAADAEEIRQYIVLSDEFHRICDKWRARAEELLSIERWPMEERFPGWVGSALRELSQKLRTTALAKARGEATQ